MHSPQRARTGTRPRAKRRPSGPKTPSRAPRPCNIVDFIVAFQRLDRNYRMSLANDDGLWGDIFALDARGEVASWYRDLVAYKNRHR
jgi:hypothetical protein